MRIQPVRNNDDDDDDDDLQNFPFFFLEHKYDHEIWRNLRLNGICDKPNNGTTLADVAVAAAATFSVAL